MKNIVIIIVLILSALSTQAQNYQLSPNESSIAWTGYGEIGDFTQSGTLEFKEGKLEYHNGRFVSGTLVIDMKTITHADRKLEKHLKADDFFDVKKYPTATLELISGSSSTIDGSLTLHGITKSISMNIEIKEDGEVLAVLGEMSIDRTMFDVKYNSSTYFQDLGNYAIKNEFDINVSLSFEGLGSNKSE